VRDERFDGYIVPMENGSLAVVGEHGEAIDELMHRITSAMRSVS
jgi:hypothetical protein